MEWVGITANAKSIMTQARVQGSFTLLQRRDFIAEFVTFPEEGRERCCVLLELASNLRWVNHASTTGEVAFADSILTILSKHSEYYGSAMSLVMVSKLCDFLDVCATTGVFMEASKLLSDEAQGRYLYDVYVNQNLTGVDALALLMSEHVMGYSYTRKSSLALSRCEDPRVCFIEAPDLPDEVLESAVQAGILVRCVIDTILTGYVYNVKLVKRVGNNDITLLDGGIWYGMAPSGTNDVLWSSLRVVFPNMMSAMTAFGNTLLDVRTNVAVYCLMQLASEATRDVIAGRLNHALNDSETYTSGNLPYPRWPSGSLVRLGAEDNEVVQRTPLVRENELSWDNRMNHSYKVRDELGFIDQWYHGAQSSNFDSVLILSDMRDYKMPETVSIPGIPLTFRVANESWGITRSRWGTDGHALCRRELMFLVVFLCSCCAVGLVSWFWHSGDFETRVKIFLPILVVLIPTSLKLLAYSLDSKHGVVVGLRWGSKRNYKLNGHHWWFGKLQYAIEDFLPYSVRRMSLSDAESEDFCVHAFKSGINVMSNGADCLTKGLTSARCTSIRGVPTSKLGDYRCGNLVHRPDKRMKIDATWNLHRIKIKALADNNLTSAIDFTSPVFREKLQGELNVGHVVDLPILSVYSSYLSRYVGDQTTGAHWEFGNLKRPKDVTRTMCKPSRVSKTVDFYYRECGSLPNTNSLIVNSKDRGRDYYAKLIVYKMSKRATRRLLKSRRSYGRCVVDRGHAFIIHYYEPGETTIDINVVHGRSVIRVHIIHIEPTLGRGWINQRNGLLHRLNAAVRRRVIKRSGPRLWGIREKGSPVEPPLPDWDEDRLSYLSRVTRTWVEDSKGTHIVWIAGYQSALRLSRRLNSFDMDNCCLEIETHELNLPPARRPNQSGSSQGWLIAHPVVTSKY
jgi:hypothetical protein